MKTKLADDMLSELGGDAFTIITEEIVISFDSISGTLMMFDHDDSLELFSITSETKLAMATDVVRKEGVEIVIDGHEIETYNISPVLLVRLFQKISSFINGVKTAKIKVL